MPKQPDNVDEQKAIVEQNPERIDHAVIFIPVDDVAMIPSVKLLNDAGIPVVLVSNPLPASFVNYVGADDFEIGYREARYLFEHLGGNGCRPMTAWHSACSTHSRPPTAPLW